MIELLRAGKEFTNQNLRDTYVARRRASWVETAAREAEDARNGFHGGIVRGLISMALAGLTGGNLHLKPKLQPSHRQIARAQLAMEDIKRKRATDLVLEDGHPFHDVLLTARGWPKIPFDGRLLVTQQDALLMGGKVQALLGFADHIVFRDLRLCAAYDEKTCIAMCSGQAITLGANNLLVFEREKCIHCEGCLWNCAKSADGVHTDIEFSAGVGASTRRRIEDSCYGLAISSGSVSVPTAGPPPERGIVLLSGETSEVRAGRTVGRALSPYVMIDMGANRSSGRTARRVESTDPIKIRINNDIFREEKCMSLKRLIKSYCPSPVIRLGKGVRHFARLAQSRRLIRRLQNSSLPIKLELGSGRKKGLNGWTTLDLAPGCDLYCDLARGIPFPDNSVVYIYSSHFFEHLTFKQTQVLLDECMRVMSPGGRFSICVPNAKLFLTAYVNNETLDKQFLAWAPAHNNTTRMDYVNYIAYMDGAHEYMFDGENLVHILKAKGFRNVRIRDFDEEIDLEGRRHESIYAEGIK